MGSSIARAGATLALAQLLTWTAAANPEAQALLPAQALREAIAAREQGDYARALAQLTQVSERDAVVADHADLLRVQIRIEAGEALQAVKIGRAATSRHAHSPIISDLWRALGDAQQLAGDEAAARRAWELALAKRPDKQAQASLQFAIAQSLERSGKATRAAEHYEKIWVHYPVSAEAEQATARLDALEAELASSLRNATDYRTRGDKLLAEGRNELALAAYDDALSRIRSRAAKTRSLRGRAKALFRLRRYHEAAPAYALLAPDPEADIQRARAIARSGDVPGGIRELEALAKQHRGSIAARARLIAAILLDGEGEVERADAIFADLAKQSHHSASRTAALWRLGWSAYRAGRYAEARERLAELEARERDPIDALRARYWSARSLDRLNDIAAVSAYSVIAGQYPFSYYGWRARERLPVEPGAPPPLAIPEGSRKLKPSELARARILLEAGMRDEAGVELERLAGRARGLEDRLELSRLLSEAGRFHRAQLLVVAAYQEELARGPMTSQEELWRHAWPLAYAELIRENQPERSPIDDSLVAAVMREESGYRAEVTSTAGARGLLQIMPETGERLAREAGLPSFAPDDLYLPHINILLGSLYLRNLTLRFEGHTDAVVASYNAGPHNASRWLNEQAGLPNDEWVEAIPYRQTRNYVKRVLRSVHAYRELY